MGIVYLFYRILEYLGIWEKVPNIVFLGLGDAGRNTLLRRLRDEGLLDDQHTLYLNGEEYRIGNIKFRAFDYDRPEIPRVLRDYHIQVDGVVYVFGGNWDVDDFSLDNFRNRRELIRLRGDELLGNVPLREFEDVRLAIDGLELFISGVAAMVPYGGRNQYLNLEPLRLYACIIIITYVVVSGCAFLTYVRHLWHLWTANATIEFIRNGIIPAPSQGYPTLFEKHPVIMGTFMFA